MIVARNLINECFRGGDIFYLSARLLASSPIRGKLMEFRLLFIVYNSC
jgi:hypothetical protein